MLFLYPCFWLLYSHLKLTRYWWIRTEINKIAANHMVCGCIICSVSVVPLGGFTLFPYETGHFPAAPFYPRRAGILSV